MRLPMLTRGQSTLQRVLFRIARTLMPDIPGPVLVMSYRQKFFGKHFSALLHQCMRGREHWSVAEVELFAAFVSKKNACNY